MLRCPSRIENLLRYQDMHALQLLFLLAVKAPQKKKKKKEQHKVIGTDTQTMYRNTCIARSLLFSFTFG